MFACHPILVDCCLRLWHRRNPIALQVVLLGFLSTYDGSRGRIEAARVLGRLSDVQSRLLVIDGGQDTVGGFFDLRRQQLDAEKLDRRTLGEWLRRNHPEARVHALVHERPLAPELVPRPWRLEAVGVFGNWPDLQAGMRRWVYRLTSER